MLQLTCRNSESAWILAFIFLDQLLDMWRKTASLLLSQCSHSQGAKSAYLTTPLHTMSFRATTWGTVFEAFLLAEHGDAIASSSHNADHVKLLHSDWVWCLLAATQMYTATAHIVAGEYFKRVQHEWTTDQAEITWCRSTYYIITTPSIVVTPIMGLKSLFDPNRTKQTNSLAADPLSPRRVGGEQGEDLANININNFQLTNHTSLLKILSIDIYGLWVWILL